MLSQRVRLGVCLASAFLGFTGSAAADKYPVILHGKVVMEDGSTPPVIMGIERVCSDVAGSMPGVLTDKKGEYIWRMEIDPLETRDCKIRATHAGYTSTEVEVSGIDTTHTTLDLPPVVVRASAADPSAIIVANNIPGRSKKDWDAALKALDASDFAAAASHLEAFVAASPKFAPAWHDLGLVDERINKRPDARTAYEHAIAADPKLLPPYVTLERLCIKMKDWEGAEKAAAALIKADPKHAYPEVYLHEAVAEYELKNYDGALANVQEAMALDPGHRRPRAEYVLGRILEAKGDISGARQHIAKYLQLDPAPVDVDLVKGHLELIGKPEAADVNPELEPL